MKFLVAKKGEEDQAVSMEVGELVVMTKKTKHLRMIGAFFMEIAGEIEISGPGWDHYNLSRRKKKWNRHFPDICIYEKRDIGKLAD